MGKGGPFQSGSDNGNVLNVPQLSALKGCKLRLTREPAWRIQYSNSNTRGVRMVPAKETRRRVSETWRGMQTYGSSGSVSGPLLVQPQHAITQALNFGHVVTHEYDRASLACDVAHFAEAFVLKEASPTARTSSTSRISGSTWAATARARRTYMPEE